MAALGLHKGSMQLVDEARVESLQAAGGKPTFVSLHAMQHH